MKLKYNFVINNIAGSAVAVPVGKNASDFKGYIKLNETGAYIFERLMNGAERDDILNGIISDFEDITREDAATAVDEFLGELKESGVLCE